MSGLTKFAKCIGLGLAMFSLSASVWGQRMGRGILSPPANVRPPGLKGVGIEQRLNEQIPAELVFRDETGQSLKLGDYFGSRPMILNLVYYKCPMLCGEVLSGLTSALKPIKLDAGKDFDILTISFDPRETPQDAIESKAVYLKRYGHPEAEKGWHFLTGRQESIDGLTKAAGFQYQYDATIGQFAHSTAIMVLTPEGRIAQYYYGVEYPPKDLRLGLVQASQHKIGTLVDQLLLYCYHYNPSTGKYGAVIMNIMQLASAATLLFLGAFIFVLWRRDPGRTKSSSFLGRVS